MKIVLLLLALLAGNVSQAFVSNLSPGDNALAAKAAEKIAGDTMHLYKQTSGECQVDPPCLKSLFLRRTARFSRLLTPSAYAEVQRWHHISCFSEMRSTTWSCAEGGTTVRVGSLTGEWRERPGQGSPPIDDDKLVRLAKYGASQCFLEQVVALRIPNPPLDMRIMAIELDPKSTDYRFNLPLKFNQGYYIYVREGEAGDSCPFTVARFGGFII